MNTAIVNTPAPIDSAIMASLVLTGDLSKLNNQQKVSYYHALCDRIGLDPATQPFKLLNLKGKEILYADKGAAQQLNRLYKISHEIMRKDTIQDVYCVTVRASNANGFQDEDGAVSIAGMKDNELANCFLKCVTKAKRRATLALCGLSMMDESELDTLPEAKTMPLVLPGTPVVEKSADVPSLSRIDETVEPIQSAEVVAPQLGDKETLGRYVIPFGVWKNRSLETLSEAQITRTLEWAKSKNLYSDCRIAMENYLQASDLPF